MTLETHKRSLGKCTYCPKLCRFCCPTAEVEHSETVTPWGKMTLAEMVREERVDLAAEVGEVFYHCFACLHCRTHCTHRIDVPGALIEARARALSSGTAATKVDAVLGRFRDTGNTTGEDLSKLLLEQIEAKYLEPDAQAVLFFGCDALRYRAEHGNELLLLGNIDKRVLREGCTRADIEREVMSKVPQLVEQGGYSPFVDHAVPPDVPFENFKYYMGLVDELCTLE